MKNNMKRSEKEQQKAKSVKLRGMIGLFAKVLFKHHLVDVAERIITASGKCWATVNGRIKSKHL
jgi:hypothetical protein